MPRIEWTPAMSVGNEQLDEQHQQLLDLYNLFDDAAARGRGWRELNTMLAQLEDYIHVHFAYEERVLADAGYPDLEHHRNLHEQLARKLAAFREEVAMHRRVTQEFRKFLGYWWQQHILEHDLDYAGSLGRAEDSGDET
jgi:hemerythrin-like metal-binding protein